MKYLNKLVEIVLEILVCGMVLGCVWQVFTRFILHDPSKYTEELLRYMLIWVTFMGVPYAYGQDRHLSINIFMNKNTKKNDALVKLFVDVFVVALCVLVMLVGGVMVTGNAAGQLSAAMQLPMEVYYVCVPISGVLMVIYGIDKILKHIKDYRLESKKDENLKVKVKPEFKKAV